MQGYHLHWHLHALTALSMVKYRKSQKAFYSSSQESAKVMYILQEHDPCPCHIHCGHFSSCLDSIWASLRDPKSLSSPCMQRYNFSAANQTSCRAWFPAFRRQTFLMTLRKAPGKAHNVGIGPPTSSLSS